MAIIPRKNNLFFVAILTVSIILSFSFTTTVASQDLVYKQPRPMKTLSGTPIKSDSTSGKGMIIEAKGAEYVYDPTGKTDPFKSFIDLMEEVEKKKRQKPKTYLETLDLSQLDLIAIIVGPEGNWAMVREPKGTGHVIKKGTPIGLHGGVVYEIDDQQVVVREEYKDFRGETKYKDIAKKVPALQ